MTNHQAGLIAGAILLAGGAIGTSLGLIAGNNIRQQGGEVLGGFVVAAGAILGITALIKMARSKSE